MRIFQGFVAACLTLAASTQGARAQAAADFYRGKTLSLVVSTTAGSSYDLMSRNIARYLPKYLPGAPAIVIRNQPGAGGIAAVNSLFHTAPKDGTVFAAIQGSVPFEPLLGTKEADFDARKFNWLGSPSAELCVLTVWGAAKVNSIDDMKNEETTVGSSGANSNPSFYARLINSVLGTKIRIVFGYPGQPEVFQAMEKGEVDGHPCGFWSALVSTRPDWIRDRKVKLLLQYGPEKEPALGATPFLSDLVTKADDRMLVEAALAPIALGRPYLAPPDVPPDRVAALRQAMQDVFRDHDFLAETRKLGLFVNARQTGDDVLARIRGAYAMPAPIIERLRKLSNQ